MKYYYDSTDLGVTLEDARLILRTNNNFFDCERFDLATKEWVLDRNFSSKVFEGQKEVEEITEEQALKRIVQMMGETVEREYKE